MGLRVGIDIGGTFTDFVVFDSETGRYEIGKTLSTPSDPSEAVLAGLSSMLRSSERFAGRELEAVIHATTIATNTVLERKGPPTALLTTEGFRDLLIIGRQKRYELYDNEATRPPPLVPRHHVWGVPERMLWDGSVERPLDEAAVRRIAQEMRREGIVAVAVCLLHAYANPDHERRIEEILIEEAPELLVSLSSDVSPVYREFERASTTVMNAYVMPGVARYVENLDRELRHLGALAPMLIMQSNGGVATSDLVKRFPIRIIESGPAAGALTAARFAPAAGTDKLLSFDMGGTTAKLCLVEDGRPALTSQFEVDMAYLKKGSGLPISIPPWISSRSAQAAAPSPGRELGAIAVGPQSAGSEPGPVCYGRGGTQPTVTDADLVLGYLNPAYFLGGEMELDSAGAKAAIEARSGQASRHRRDGCRLGHPRGRHREMAQAARAVTISAGKDPRRLRAGALRRRRAGARGAACPHARVPEGGVPPLGRCRIRRRAPDGGALARSGAHAGAQPHAGDALRDQRRLRRSRDPRTPAARGE